MMYPLREAQFKTLFPDEKKFRLTQIKEALFSNKYNSWAEITTLPITIREKIQKSIPWITFTQKKVLKDHNTHKAIVELQDKYLIETVLMKNKKDAYTICVSSQVGCAMNCSFCATGKMGFKRNLTSDEISDQLRFWQIFLKNEDKRISNIVFMGMGEPLNNFINIKKSILDIIKYTDIGPTYITVSTAGVLPVLNKILEDSNWPNIRIAISLHSADPITRKKIMPSSTDKFLDDILVWSKKYLETHGNKRHYLTFEYIMLKNINDTKADAYKLLKFIKNVGHAKVNLIPYNKTESDFDNSERITQFMNMLQDINVTRRLSMGQNIEAACGQLIKKNYAK